VIRVDFGPEWGQGGLNLACGGGVDLSYDLFILMVSLSRLFGLILLRDNFAVLFFLKNLLQKLLVVIVIWLLSKQCRQLPVINTLVEDKCVLYVGHQLESFPLFVVILN